MTAKASLAAVAKGSDTVFLVTTPDFMSGGGTQEQIHGKYVADVASEAGVKHLIYSSLLHVTETTNGRLKHVVHFDDKAEVERYIRSKGTKTLSSGNCRYSVGAISATRCQKRERECVCVVVRVCHDRFAQRMGVRVVT